jgi:hypothetical protein
LVNELNAYTTEGVASEMDPKNQISKAQYNENLYAVGKKTFDETIRQIRYPADHKKAENLLASSDILEKVDELDINILINLIEILMVKRFKKQRLNEKETNILSKYKNIIFESNEPISLLEEKQKERSEPTKPKRGRTKDLTKAAKIKKVKEKDVVEEDIEYGGPVLFHILDLLRADKSGYKATTKWEKGDANIRIYKPDEDVWRDTTEIEKLAYNTLIQLDRQEQFAELFGDEKIYGTIIQDNTFRIIDKSKENVKAKKNRHYEVRGQECTSPTYKKLTDLLYKLKLRPSDFELTTKEIPKEEEGLKKYLFKEKEYNTDDMTKAEMIAAAQWVSTGLKKDGLCKYIQQYFDANNLLYKLIK